MTMSIKDEVKEIVELRKIVSSATQEQFFNLMMELKKRGKLNYSNDAVDIVKMMYDIRVTPVSSRTC